MKIFLLLAAMINQEVVEVYSKPLVRLNGQEEILDLDEVNPVLKKALVGMKEGEKKSLLIDCKEVFIELIQADATFETHAATAKEDSELKNFF